MRRKSRKSHFSFARFFSRILFLLGVISLGMGVVLLYQHYSPNRLVFASEKRIEKPVNRSQKGLESLLIPAAMIDLPIHTKEIKNGKWEVSSTGVSYLDRSAFPGEIGNSIFYGHNWTSLLGRLVTVRVGDAVIITFDDGSKKEFRVRFTYEVYGSESSILADSNHSQLTIYTCSGFLDRKRFVVIAEPI